MREWFSHISRRISEWSGSPSSFLLALSSVFVWAITGPIFKYSETWQLVINTGTTIVTFLMVFLIQNSQNRDGKVLHLKLDELLRAVESAHTDMVSLDDLTEAELDRLKARYSRLGRVAAKMVDETKEELDGRTDQSGDVKV